MKKVIGQVTLCLLVPMFLYGKGPDEMNPEEMTYTTEQLSSLRGRFETGVHVGYVNMANASQNTKNTSLSDYSSELSGGVNAGAYVGYNFTNHWNVKLQYKYRSAKGSALYTMQMKSTASPLLYLEDHYQFHQMGAVVNYRFNLYDGRLFFAPGAGGSFIHFQNNGQLVSDYSQTSNAAILDGYLALEYFISNNIGIGFTYYASSEVNFKDPKLNMSESDGTSLIGADTKFSFTDMSFRLMVVF